jgi:hypothetical protein
MLKRRKNSSGRNQQQQKQRDIEMKMKRLPGKRFSRVQETCILLSILRLKKHVKSLLVDSFYNKNNSVPFSVSYDVIKPQPSETGFYFI